MTSRLAAIAALLAVAALLRSGAAVAMEESVQKPPVSPIGKTLEVVVQPDSYAFAPQVVTIHPGDIVRWTNHDKQKHLVVTQDPSAPTTELLVYKTLQPGESFEHQFQKANNYNFFCAIHFQMWGTIAVVP